MPHRDLGAALLGVALTGALALAQSQPPAPQPYPRPAAPAAGTERPNAPVQQAPSTPSAGEQETPSEATLGLPIYPSAQFIASYDAGRGQRYFIFGTTGSFADVVAYYKQVLKQKGDLVFDEPPVHMFEVGRFREESMAFPPSITVKDYTWGGSEGYLNPKPGAQPARFPTVVQIVPIPAGTGQASR